MASTSWKDLIGKAEDVGDFTPLPAGTYNVEVDSAEHTTTSKGKDMYVFYHKVVDGPHAGRKQRHNIVISPESPTALGIAFRDLATLGVSAEFLATEPDPSAVCAKALGAAVKITTAPQKDKPEYMEVKSLRPRDGVAPAAAPSGGGSAPPSAPF